MDLWRAVMPVFNVAITGPDDVEPIWPRRAAPPDHGTGSRSGRMPQGGYQHDARFGTLQEQARGALFAHAEVDVEPPVRLLDDLAAFQQTLFSSRGVETPREGDPLWLRRSPIPTHELDELEEQGKVVFNRACATCHGGPLHPSTTTPDVDACDAQWRRWRATSTFGPPVRGRPRTRFAPCAAAASAQCADLPASRSPNGTMQVVTTSDPGRMLLTGQPADVGMMDVTQPSRHRHDGPVLPQQLRRNARGGARPLRCVLQTRGQGQSASEAAARSCRRTGWSIDRGFVAPEERVALLAYLRKL